MPCRVRIRNGARRFCPGKCYSSPYHAYHTTHYHTMLYHIMHYHTVLCYTILYHTKPHHTIPYHTKPHHTIPYHTIPYHTIPYHTIPYHTIPYHEALYKCVDTTQYNIIHTVPYYTPPLYDNLAFFMLVYALLTGVSVRVQKDDVRYSLLNYS